jgi:hypothetical protein
LIPLITLHNKVIYSIAFNMRQFSIVNKVDLDWYCCIISELQS